jgi:DNA-binding HxlR family transcriptional regulator
LVKLPGTRVRGSHTGRPIMVLLDILGQRWTLRLLWELGQGDATFRALRSRCDDVSPSLLNQRLKGLRELALVDLGDKGYTLTSLGMTLAKKLSSLDIWANEWANMLEEQRPLSG